VYQRQLSVPSLRYDTNRYDTIEESNVNSKATWPVNE